MSKKQDIFDDGSLEKESPLLHSIPKENQFSVPTDYFDSLPSEILEKCREEVQPKQWGIGLLTTLLGFKWKLLTITGCVAIICFFAIRMNNRTVSYEAMTQNIPDSLIVEHLDKNLAFISESTLEEASENMPETSENNSASTKIKSDSTNTDQDIIAYLMNSNVSVSEIENVP